MQPTRDKWLERWKRHYDGLSSTFALRKFYDRGIVDITYNMLLEFWGDDFFEFDFLEKLQRNDLHFVQSLVFKCSIPAFYRLAEVCFLLDYAQTYNKEQYRLLTAFKDDSDKVRDTLCEVLLEYAFREANIEYEANPVRGNQILEGYCVLNGERFLVECKNKYSMNQDELKVICFITGKLMAFGQKMPAANLGVGYIFFKDKGITEIQTHKILDQVIEYLASNKKLHIDGVFEDDNLRVEMKGGTKENYDEYHSGAIKANVDFFFKNTFELDEKQNLIFNLHVGHRSTANQRELAEKLKKTVKKAREQHKEDSARGRIICIFNEFLTDFRPPLVVDSAVFVKDISKYLETKTTDDIVIMIDRYFNLQKTIIKPHIMGHDHLLPFKKALYPVEYNIGRRLSGKIPL